MRICHVITRLIIGGAQENTVLTCRGLVERNHDVLLAAGAETGPEGSLWPQAHASGAELVQLEHMQRAVELSEDRKAVGELVELFRDWAPDVVHTHSSKAGIIGRKAAARAGVPIVVHTIHGMSFNRTQPAPVRWLYRALEKVAARRTHRIVCVADAMTNQALAARLAPKDRFVTIRSGMDTDQFRPDPHMRAQVRTGWGVGESGLVIGTVARLFDNKGYDEIIQAMPAIVRAAPRAKFIWIGHGPHRERYAKRLDKLGLRDRVTFVGLVPPDEVARLINSFDILLHASRWEGLPRAVVQALLTEVPVVSFDNDGASEVVINDETGVCVPYGDVARLAEGVALLASDPKRRAELGRNGRERCLSDFDWRTMVDRLDALYAKLAVERGLAEPVDDECEEPEE